MRIPPWPCRADDQRLARRLLELARVHRMDAPSTTTLPELESTIIRLTHIIGEDEF